MKARHDSRTAAAIWDRVIRFDPALSATAARALLRIRFSEEDLARMRELLQRSRAGTLSLAETEELDAYEHLGAVLDILHAKARLALKKPSSKPAS